MYYQHLKTKGNTKLSKEDRIIIFVAGDDAQANLSTANNSHTFRK
jgi:hypothetical protein